MDEALRHCETKPAFSNVAGHLLGLLRKWPEYPLAEF